MGYLVIASSTDISLTATFEPCFLKLYKEMKNSSDKMLGVTEAPKGHPLMKNRSSFFEIKNLLFRKWEFVFRKCEFVLRKCEFVLRKWEFVFSKMGVCFFENGSLF